MEEYGDFGCYSFSQAHPLGIHCWTFRDTSRNDRSTLDDFGGESSHLRFHPCPE